MDMRYLHVGWWNAKLSPAGATHAHDVARWQVAVDVITNLIDGEQLDLLGLCEVSHGDCLRLQQVLQPKGFRVVAADPKHGIDVALIASDGKLAVADSPVVLRTAFFGQACIAGVHTKLVVAATGTTLDVFAVHWPSRLFDDGAKRSTMARAVRERLASVVGTGAATANNALVMGDFNDEPFDDSVTDALQTTRERSHARKKPMLLYNPFWRLLGERQAIEDEAASPRLCAGTCHWRSGVDTKWRTFDQILVSSSLLDPPGWVLREGGSRILHPTALVDASGKLKSKFDHLPVTTLLEAR